MKREATLFQQFLRYVSLNVCGMIGLSGYILADTYFVAKGLGANGLASLNLAIPIYSFVHGSGLMLGMGGATKYTIMRGQGNEKQANRLFSQAVCLCMMLAAAFLLMGIFLSGRITALLGAHSEIYDMTRTYIRVILLFSPAFMLNDIFNCFVRNDGNPGLSMGAMLAGSLANIALDYVFIFPLGMGILGAVLATGVAPLIGIAVLSRHWSGKKSHISLVRPADPMKLTASILSLGAPSLITEVASGVVMIVCNTIILGLLGNIGVAAYGVVANLSLVVTSIYTGIAQGAQPLVSRAFGCGDKKGVKQGTKYAIITVLVCSACIYAVFFAAADPITGLFNSEGNMQLQKIAVEGMRLYFTAIAFVGVNLMLSVFFTSTEQALPAQLISLSRGFFVVIPMALLLSGLFGMTGVWLSYGVTEGIVALAGTAYYFRAEAYKNR